MVAWSYPSFKLNWNIFVLKVTFFPWDTRSPNQQSFHTVEMRSKLLYELLIIQVREATHTSNPLSQELCIIVMVEITAYLKPNLKLIRWKLIFPGMLVSKWHIIEYLVDDSTVLSDELLLMMDYMVRPMKLLVMNTLLFFLSSDEFLERRQHYAKYCCGN